MNFLKNGFRRIDTQSSSRKETLEENAFAANTNKEAEIDAYIKGLQDVGIDKQKSETYFEFSVNPVKSADNKHNASRGSVKAQVVAFETHSSVGSENCSLESIQVTLDDSSNYRLNEGQAQGVTNRRSFWGYFKREKQKPKPRPSRQTHGSVPESARELKSYGCSNKMQTI